MLHSWFLKITILFWHSDFPFTSLYNFFCVSIDQVEDDSTSFMFVVVNEWKTMNERIYCENRWMEIQKQRNLCRKQDWKHLESPWTRTDTSRQVVSLGSPRSVAIACVEHQTGQSVPLFGLIEIKLARALFVFCFCHRFPTCSQEHRRTNRYPLTCPVGDTDSIDRMERLVSFQPSFDDLLTNPAESCQNNHMWER